MKSQELFPTLVISFVQNHVMWAVFFFFFCSLPSPSCSPVSCFFCLFCHLVALSFLCLSLPPSAFVSPLWFSSWESLAPVRSRHHPRALFSCISMRRWALNNIRSQQTFKRARLASYMIGWCAVLLLLGALVFWRRGRESQSRERFGSFMGLNLPLYGVEGSLR